MTQEHPITPPTELVQQWAGAAKGYYIPGSVIKYIAHEAARWGADQELEACCEWLDRNNQWARCDIEELREGRRPKSPSLKEQALQALYRFDDTEGHADLTLGQIEEDFVVIRRAIESLPE
jgi:hypothetical protein